MCQSALANRTLGSSKCEVPVTSGMRPEPVEGAVFDELRPHTAAL